MTAISGRTLLDLYESSGRVGCLAKMLLVTSRWASTTCLLTWRDLATPGRRLLFRLLPSMPDTDETECGLLPTPAATSYGTNQGGAAGRVGPIRPSLATMARKNLWPTATSRDWRSGKASAATHARNSRPLSEQVGGSLNPAWVEWLMGYPAEWTALEPSAMQSSRKSRKKSFAQSTP
jgi:hypothetical protein